MANLPSEKNDRENVKGWQEQLNDLRPLLSTDISAENKTAVKASISEASRGHVEIVMQNEHITADVTPPHEINTSGVRDTLREDMKEMNFDILQEKQILPVDASMSPGEVKVFETVMNQGFMDERITPAENDPELSAGQEIREKLKNVAASLHKNSKNLDQESMKKLDLAFSDLSQRIQNVISTGGPALEENLKKLSDEVATVGTPEWEKRFADTSDTRSPTSGIPEKANPADALGGHILNEAIDAIEKKLNTAVVTVEMAFRNNAFDEKRMEKFHSVALDIAERIQKVIDERSSYSTEHTLKRLEELSAEIPAIGKEEATPPPIKEAMPTEGQPNTNHQQTQTITQKRLDNLESLKPTGEIENADLIKYHSRQRQTREEKQKSQESAAEAEDVSVPEETNEDVAKETIPEKKTEIDAEIEAQFQKDFALAEEDLKNLTAEVGDGAEKKTVRFSDLTSGQQILLLANLKDFALDNAKEQALKNFTESEKEKYDNAGFIKKAWLSFTKTYRRSADMAQMEKDILAKPQMDKETYREVLREMLAAASEAPEAEWKDGKLQINFVLEKDFEGLPAGKEMVKNFNDAAAKFANISPEWVYSEKEGEKKQYDEARAAYVLSRGQLLALKSGGGKEDEALAYTASLDKKVQFNQLFNASPDVEKMFAAAKDQTALWEGTKALLTEKGKLMIAGRALSTLGVVGGTALAIGSGLGAPLAAALAGGFAGGALSGGVIGRYMAGKRAGQELEDKKTLAGMGMTDQSNEKEFRSAHKEQEGIEIGVGLADKLSYAVNRVLGAKTAEEKEKLLKVLADRTYYTEQKLTLGVVNFGEGADGFKNRYELLSALATARTLHQMNEPKTNEKIEKKIDEMLGTQKERIETAEEKFKSAKMRQGAKYGILLGGTFGTLLSSISYAHVHGENAFDGETGVAAATAFAKPSLADEVLAKMNPSKILPNEEVAVQPERIPDIGPLPKEVLPASTADIIPTPNEAATTIVAPPSEKFSADWPAEVKGAPGTQSGVELLSPRKISIENSFEELGKTYTVKTGDNVWNIIKAKLGGNENFAKLPPREQNFIIDSIKDKIVKMSPKELQEIGIKGDPNRVYPGDELKLGKVFHSSDDLVKIFNRAADSSPVTEQHAIVPPAAEPTPVISPSAEEPVILAQNENIIADVAPPLQPGSVAPDIHHEIFAPTGGRSEVFLTRAEDIPSYADYKSMVYDEIHLRHPNIERSLYDMRMKDFLAGNPNGLEDLKRVFHMQGVQTPKILPQETLNGSVLDWWTRQVVQDDFNRHGGSIASESLASTHENEISRHLSESATRTRESVYRSETENPKMTQANAANVSAVTKKIYKIFDTDTRSS